MLCERASESVSVIVKFVSLTQSITCTHYRFGLRKPNVHDMAIIHRHSEFELKSNIAAVIVPDKQQVW
jgi:hypothetical protein